MVVVVVVVGGRGVLRRVVAERGDGVVLPPASLPLFLKRHLFINRGKFIPMFQHRR